MVALRRRRALGDVVLVRLGRGRLGGGRGVATDAVVLPENGRVLAGHGAVAHVFLIAVSVGGLAPRVVGHPAAQDLQSEMVSPRTRWSDFRGLTSRACIMARAKFSASFWLEKLRP